jgi:hypothetical protein
MRHCDLFRTCHHMASQHCLRHDPGSALCGRIIHACLRHQAASSLQHPLRALRVPGGLRLRSIQTSLAQRPTGHLQQTALHLPRVHRNLIQDSEGYHRHRHLMCCRNQPMSNPKVGCHASRPIKLKPSKDRRTTDPGPTLSLLPLPSSTKRCRRHQDSRQSRHHRPRRSCRDNFRVRLPCLCLERRCYLPTAHSRVSRRSSHQHQQ